MSKIIAVCPSCQKDDNFNKTLSPDYYCCESCKTILHYTEMDYKIEHEQEITTKGITVGISGHITRNGEFPGFPFTKGDAIGT
jgi:transcription initiation factor TFIIIB Brf1 subunit/transcription initiation factor TFIIB